MCENSVMYYVSTAYNRDGTEQTLSVSQPYQKLPVVPNENTEYIRCASWRVNEPYFTQDHPGLIRVSLGVER